ncbi:MAG: hypothetical protein QOE72_3254 [Chloroflexota bacterium]|jgi:hypothetical protein|nr:hypothetical protein [Chloroflexota bacterium]
MRIRPFTELVTPDERTLRYTPLGLSMAGMLAPEAAADFEQGVIASADLVDGVPQGVRDSFERIRTCHSYGVLWYEAFTVAAELAPIILEQALRERFVSFYGGSIPVESPSGQGALVDVRDFGDVVEKFRRGGTHAKGAKGWKLRSRSGGQPIPVPLTLGPLTRWARREGLLHGQRNKRIEPLRARIRNRFAHGTGFRIRMPTDSARTVRDLAETINRLWGAATPGGRLYPAPLAREVIAVGWSQRDDQCSLVRLCPDQIPGHLAADGGDWTYLLLLAVQDDEELWDFDARYELTTFPCELLWGPGDGMNAYSWWQSAEVKEDAVEYLDRLFLVRVDGDKIYLPQRPEVVFRLSGDRQSGVWYLIRADYPLDAWGHVRHQPAGICRAADEPFSGCAVEEVATGTWDDIRDALAHSSVVGAEPATSPPYLDARVPRRFSYPADVGYE